MAVQESITILHLSDPQFGKNHRFGNLGLTEVDAQFDTLFQRLSDDLAFLEKDKVKPQLVVVSGDLAEWGLKKEFEDVLTLLVKLTERLNLPRRHVVIVPGNHDVNRKLCEGYFSQCEGREEKPVAPYWPKWEFYNWLFQQFYGEEKGITFSLEEPWTLWELEELNLVVAGLNSTMSESHRDEDHYGWIGEKQLRWFAERLMQAKERGWFRLGVVQREAVAG
jgi:3',5'-cyclic AMP phosphodiesterase CpdA